MFCVCDIAMKFDHQLMVIHVDTTCLAYISNQQHFQIWVRSTSMSCIIIWSQLTSGMAHVQQTGCNPVINFNHCWRNLPSPPLSLVHVLMKTMLRLLLFLVYIDSNVHSVWVTATLPYSYAGNIPSDFTYLQMDVPQSLPTTTWDFLKCTQTFLPQQFSLMRSPKYSVVQLTASSSFTEALQILDQIPYGVCLYCLGPSDQERHPGNWIFPRESAHDPGNQATTLPLTVT